MEIIWKQSPSPQNVSSVETLSLYRHLYNSEKSEIMKGKLKSRRNPQVFKPGNVPHNKRVGVQRKRVTEEAAGGAIPGTQSKYIRLSRGLYDQSCEAERGEVPRILDSQGIPVDICMLRPSASTTKPGTTTLDRSRELDCYRIFHYGKTEDLWNEAIDGHRTMSPRCHGRLQWDVAYEQQRGFVWRERLQCEACQYCSPSQNLFTEVETGRRGRKPGALNRAVQVGLTHTSISNSALRNIFWAMNIPAPASSGMQKQANMVGPILEEVNKQDLDKRLEGLIRLCKVNNSRDPVIRLLAEGDCRYNNALASGVGKTPYQPGTQAVYTIAENITPRKNVIQVVCKNKLCQKAASLRSAGHTVKCPDHEGHCSANLDPYSSIGDEGEWAAEGFRNMLEGRPNLAIQYFTTDGDSRAFKGLEQVQAVLESTVKPVHLRDIRHLTESMRHAVKKADFSLKMFPGPTRDAREKQLHAFALELSRRCAAEFEACYQKFNGDTAKMNSALAQVPPALLMCYQGDCSECKDNSFVCEPPDKMWDKSYCPELQIYPTKNDEKLLLECIAMRLGPQSVQKTFLNTTTQKSEAFNRALSRSNPKNITMARNFTSRIASATHLNNCGIAKSTRSKCEAVGAPLTAGTRVDTQLRKEENRIQYIRDKKKSMASKTRRSESRKKKYQEYSKKNEEVRYQKGLLDTDQGWVEHAYAGRKSEGERPGTSGLVFRRGRGRFHRN